MSKFLCLVILSLAITIESTIAANAPQLSKDQQLVVAAFELDVAKVKALLESGVSPDGRMGSNHGKLFEDKWTLGTPISTGKWTPLIAVASSHREPQPKERAINTSEGLDAAMRKRDGIDRKVIAERDSRRLEIAKMLIEAKADLDLEDGYGATALYEAIYSHYDDLALLLIEAGAALDIKNGVYIDGPGDITPLHRAVDSPQVVAAMVKRGVKVNVQDTTGSTPLHWAVQAGKLESVKLLVEAGADAAVKDKKGRKPADWCHPFKDFDSATVFANKEAILKLLSEAKAGNP